MNAVYAFGGVGSGIKGHTTEHAKAADLHREAATAHRAAVGKGWDGPSGQKAAAATQAASAATEELVRKTADEQDAGEYDSLPRSLERASHRSDLAHYEDNHARAAQHHEAAAKHHEAMAGQKHSEGAEMSINARCEHCGSPRRVDMQRRFACSRGCEDALALGGEGSGVRGHVTERHRAAASAHKEAANAHEQAAKILAGQKDSLHGQTNKDINWRSRPQPESETSAAVQASKGAGGSKAYSVSAAKGYSAMAKGAEKSGNRAEAVRYHQEAAKMHTAAARQHEVASK